jgi:putative restriction endonuclease
VERDDDVRAACFAALLVLRAQFGAEMPYVGGLDRGFAFRGRRVPFLNYQKGIYRSAAQRGPAALSVQTSANSPYGDAPTEDGFRYAYRAGSVDQPDNRALRTAHVLRVPLAYFVATRPGWFDPVFPAFVTDDDPAAREVLIRVGELAGPLDEPRPVLVDDPIARRYTFRQVRVRVHQSRFRGRVIPAYRERCAICRLREVRLLDAAHIVGDAETAGEPEVSNGLSLCSIHHRAFDSDLLGVSPEREVHVSRRLLEDDDGPMLDVLKEFHRRPIVVPRSRSLQPDRERLAERFDLFIARAG